MVPFGAAVWDFREVPGAAAYLDTWMLRVDWTTFTPARWTLVMKELLAAMLLPDDPAVAVIPSRSTRPLALGTISHKLKTGRVKGSPAGPGRRPARAASALDAAARRRYQPAQRRAQRVREHAWMMQPTKQRVRRAGKRPSGRLRASSPKGASRSVPIPNVRG